MLVKRFPLMTPVHCLKTSQRSSRRQLSLAYTKYSATQSNNENTHAPLVILHGLFGSKQNNRSISKYAAPFICRSGLQFDCSRTLAQDLRRSVYALVSIGRNTEKEKKVLRRFRTSETTGSHLMTSSTTIWRWLTTSRSSYKIMDSVESY